MKIVLHKKKIALAAAVLALACAAELCFCALSNRRGPDDYALQALGADSFESWEFEDRGGGDYYALANNSYFTLDGLSGLPADKITVLLERQEGDASECVMYCAGARGGTRGEFIVPLTKQADGVYVGYAECDALDALTVYPTERVRTTLRFDGVVINPDVPVVSFSPSRALLWASLLAAGFAAFLLVRRARKKEEGKPNLWACVYALLTAALLTAVFAATRMYTATRGLESVLLPAALALFSLLYLAVWLCAARLKSARSRAALAALVLGALFCFASAPLQAPDEHGHFLRAFALSQGSVDYDYDYAYPDDVRQLITAFPAKLYGDVQLEGKGSAAGAIAGYLASPNGGGTAAECRTSVQLLLPYVFSALGMALVRLFSGNALLCLYAGRLMNVLVYAACVYAAVGMAKRRRGALLFMALLPTTLYMAASVSYDSMFLGAAVLFFGFVLKNDFDRRDLVLSALAFGGVVMIKSIYFPLALLLFTIPKQQLRVRLPRLASVLLVCGAGAALLLASLAYANLFAVGIPPSYVPEGVNIAAQIRYVLTHPVRYLMVLLVDGWQNCFYITSYGVFGWLDVDAALTGLLVPVLFVALAALCADEPKHNKSETPLHALVVLLGYALVVTGFYATWSTLGATSILGVQSRYFIPFLPPALALLSRAFSPVLRFSGGEQRRDALCTALCAGVSLTAAAELFTMYFLM